MNEDRKPESEERSWLDRLAHFISGEPQNKTDLEGVLSLAEEHEIIDEDARKIMEGALLVTDMHVRDIMIPRAQMIVIDSDQPLQEALPKIVQSGHSRYPVIGDGIDDVIGMLLAKDLLPLIQSDGDVPSIKELMRPVIAVPESKRLNVLLREFRQNRNHMAIVIDEYGSIAGLVTIEDVLEQIVGDIEDEHDAEAPSIELMAGGRALADAGVSLEDAEDVLGAFLTDEERDEEIDTLGGLIFTLSGRIPLRGEQIAHDSGLKFLIVEATPRRIRRVELSGIKDKAP